MAAHPILLFQVASDLHSLAYSDELVDYLQTKKGPDQPLFILDNHSDAAAVHFAKKLTEATDGLLVIVEVKAEAALGPIASLLHSLLRHQSVIFRVKGHHPLLAPYMHGLQGSFFNNPEELEDYFHSNSSPSR